MTDRDQTASEEAVRSGSSLFALHFIGNRKRKVFKILEH